MVGNPRGARSGWCLNMAGLSLTVYLETSDNEMTAPEGPGWYVDVRDSYGTVDVLPRVRINHQVAEQLGMAFSAATDGRTVNPRPGVERKDMSLIDLIRAGNEDIHIALQDQLDEAERIATRIAALRRGLKEFD